MATVNFYLKTKDTGDEKRIFMRYLDKTSAGKKALFSHILPFKVNEKYWNPGIDKETKLEYWLIDDSERGVKLNQILKNWKLRVFSIRDLLVEEDNYHNKINPSVSRVETAYRERLDPNGVLILSESVSNEERSIKEKTGKGGLETTISDLFGNYIEDKGKRIGSGTVTILKTTRDLHIKTFEECKAKIITLDKLDRSLFDEMSMFLTEDKDQGGMGLGNSTAKKYLRKIREVMGYYKNTYRHMNLGFFDGDYPVHEDRIVFALRGEIELFKWVNFRRIIVDNYLKRFTHASSNGESFWTTKELAELMKVRPVSVRKIATRYDMPRQLREDQHGYQYNKQEIIEWIKDREWTDEKESLDRTVEAMTKARDLYCYASEAPARYGDLKRLDPNLHLEEGYDDNGKCIQVLKFVSEKTKVLTYIPLSEYCISIQEKYNDVTLPNRLFNCPKNSTEIGRGLHKAMELSGLFDDTTVYYEYKGKAVNEIPMKRHQALKFHSSRHNFGTHMASEGESLIHIKTAMGHKKLSTTEMYIHLVKERFYSNLLNKFNKAPKDNLVLLYPEMKGSDGIDFKKAI